MNRRPHFLSFFTITCFFLVFWAPSEVEAQKKDLTYYLPDISYNPEIPTPESFLGYQIGEWHVSHDQLYHYMKTLAASSDRVTLTEYARSHENRPLIYLTITDPDNHERLDQIKAEHRKLCDPENSNSVDIDNMPTVVYQGYSIHGNEPSGANASLLYAYYLVAGQSDDIDARLKDMIVMIDPNYNPDGLHRFSSWVNMHKSKNLVSDPSDREYTEEWPRGRTNHYWFDLNRDWLLLTHPESQGRIKTFHEWKPEILTDHHEMGTNSTFFFQPGVPSRTNPNTPQENQDLTEEIGTYHAAALDNIGSLYYTKSRFDDYYYGKGSTYPDVNGAVGILFEQASSRGHIQESANGLLTFPFTIRNQVVTSLSTHEAAFQMRKKMLEYKKRFYKDAKAAAGKSSIKGYIFSDKDRSKLNRYVEIIKSHDIDVYPIKSDGSVKGHSYSADNSYVIPTDQYQYKLIKTIFENVTEYRDSLFYDVSAWTMPLAFNLQYDALNGAELSKMMDTGGSVTLNNTGMVDKVDAPYAYAFAWTDYFAPTALYAIQKAGLRTKCLTSTLKIPSAGGTTTFHPGTMIIPIQNQNMGAAEISRFLSDLATQYPIHFVGLSTGNGLNNMTVGNPDAITLDMPKVMMVVGDGVNSYDAGEIWHLLDTRYGIPLSKIDVHDFSPRRIDRYNTIIMADGSYRNLGDSDVKAISSWVERGGDLILFRRAINWATSQKLISLKRKTGKKTEGAKSSAYSGAGSASGARVVGGSIFSADVDLSHPLLYGYTSDKISMFRRGTSFYEPPSNAYATPIKYSNNPLQSGYMPRGLSATAGGAASLTVHGKGSGRIIAFQDNVNFRGYWWGGNKLLANAIFLSDIISGSTVQYEED